MSFMSWQRMARTARLGGRAKDWLWSSVRAHLKGKDDRLVTVRPLPERVTRFADLLAAPEDPIEFTRLRAAESIGRPPGPPDFLKRIARKLGRSVEPAKRGRKPKAETQNG
jgi:putative transposase